MRVNVFEWRQRAVTLVFLSALVPVPSGAHLTESHSNAPPAGVAQHPTSLAETAAALVAFGFKPVGETDDPIYVERPPEHARARTGLENQARKLYRYGDADAALALLSEENLEREANVGDSNADDIARGWMLRARILASRKQYDEAGRAYAMATRVSPDWSAVWVEYGNFHHKQNHRQEARRGYLRALKLARAERDDGEVAVILNNLGVAYNSEGRRELARKAHEEALSIRRKLATDEPDQYLPDLAVSLMNIGLLARADKRPDDAIKSFEEALSIRHALEDDHPGAFLPDIAVTLTHLGNLYRQSRRAEDARDAFDEALSIRRMLAELDPDLWLPLVADSLADVGDVAIDDKRRQDAISAYEEARSILRRFVRAAPTMYEPQLKHIEATLVELGD